MPRAVAIVAGGLALGLGGAVGAWTVAREHHHGIVDSHARVESTSTTGKRSSLEWPTYGANNARTHAVRARLFPPFRRAWSVYGDSSFIEFPPVVARGRLFFATDRGRAVAVDAETGRLLWDRSLGRCVAASPAIAGTRVIFATMGPRPPCGHGRGSLIAADARTGRVVWRLLMSPVESSPLVVGEIAVVGARDGVIYAVDVTTGVIRWRFPTGAPVKGGASAEGGRLFIGSYDGYVYALRVRDGHRLWRARSPGGGNFYATPSVASGQIFVGSTDGFMTAFDAASGRIRWSRRLPAFIYASAAVADGRVFVGSYDHRLYALDARSGRRLWSVRVAGPVSGAPAVVGSLVFFSSCGSCSRYESNPRARRTYGVDVRSGGIVWTYPDGEYSPVVTDGRRLYLTGYTTVSALVPREGGRSRG